MSTSATFGDIPFRIRVGRIGEVQDLDESLLRDEIVKLFDEKSQTLLREAKHTALAFQFDELTPETLNTADVVLFDATSPADNTKPLDLARQQGYPIISITKSKPTELSIEEGHGLNAHLVRPLERFNAFAISDTQQQSYIDNLYNSFFETNDGIPDDAKQIIREKLLPYYVRASLLAKANQKTYRHAGLLVYSFSALAVGAVAIGVLVHQLSVLAFAIELLLLLTILFTILRANHKRAHKNWIQSRYVAERIRAAIFLTTCGVETSAIALPANVGVTGKPDQWMLSAFNEIIRRLPPLQTCHGSTSEKFVAFVKRCWLREQIEFHTQKAEKAETMNRWLERIGIILFSGAVLAAGLHLLFFALRMEWLEHPLTFAAIFLPAAGAAIGGIRTHREYSRLAVRSSNMAASLKALDTLMSTASTPEELESVLVRVEELTLLELQDWLMLMSVVKLEAA